MLNNRERNSMCEAKRYKREIDREIEKQMRELMSNAI